MRVARVLARVPYIFLMPETELILPKVTARREGSTPSSNDYAGTHNAVGRGNTPVDAADCQGVHEIVQRRLPRSVRSTQVALGGSVIRTAGSNGTCRDHLVV